MGYLGQGNDTVPIYLSLHSPSFRIHLQEDKDNCLIFLAFFLLDNKSLSIILMIELFLCNKYLSFWSWFWSIFLCFCWSCLFFLLVPLLLILLHHSFLFLQFSLLFFFLLSFFFFGLYVFLFLFFSPSSWFFSFSCVSFSSSPMLFLFCLPFFLASLHLSRLIVLAVVVLVIVPPLSQLVFLLLPSPPRAFEQENNGLKTNHFVCLSGILTKMSFYRIIVYCFGWISFIHRTCFVSCSRTIFWGSKGLFVASYLFFCIWRLAHNLLSVQLVSCACILWIRCLLCKSSSFFCVSACVVFLLWVLVCFLSILVIILGFSFLDCSVLMLFLLLHVLAARLCVCVLLGCLLRGTITESRMGMANREGSIYFSGFLIIGVFGWKQLLSPRATLFSTLFSLKNPASKRWKRTPVFNFVGGNAVKIGVSEFVLRNKSDPRLFTFLIFYLYFPDSKLYKCTLFGGLQERPA